MNRDFVPDRGKAVSLLHSVQTASYPVGTGGRRLAHEAEHSSPFSGAIPPFPQYALMAWCVINEVLLQQQLHITFLRILHSNKCLASYTQNAGVLLSIHVKRPILDLRQNWNVLADSSETLQYQISIVPPVDSGTVLP
jgi:hypothetical protein